MPILLMELTEEQRIYLMLISNLLLEIYSILYLVKIISYEEIKKSNNKFVTHKIAHRGRKKMCNKK